MKKFSIEIITQFRKYSYSMFSSKQMRDLLEAVKEIIKCLLSILISVSCHYILCTYICTDDSCELITVCTDYIESKPVDQPKIWYKHIFEDFFNKFTCNSKTINPKYMNTKPYYVIETLTPLQDNLDTVKKPEILNKVKSDVMNSIVSECKFYKNKTSLLEAQLFETKIAYHNLEKEIDDIVKHIDSLPSFVKRLFYN